MRRVVAQGLSALLVLLWAVGAIAGGMMVIGGLGLAQCGFGAQYAGCGEGPGGPLGALLGIVAIVVGAVVGYGFGASALDELRRWRP